MKNYRQLMTAGNGRTISLFQGRSSLLFVHYRLTSLEATYTDKEIWTQQVTFICIHADTYTYMHTSNIIKEKESINLRERVCKGFEEGALGNDVIVFQ